MSLIAKIHHKNNQTIIAVCDSDIIGKKFEKGELSLDLSGDFYKGKLINTQEAGDLIRNADIINLAGKEAINLGISEGIIKKENIKFVEKIPHTQAIILQQ